MSGSSMERVGNFFTSIRMPPGQPSTTSSVLPANTPMTAFSRLRSTAASLAETQRAQKSSGPVTSLSEGSDCQAAMMRSSTSSWGVAVHHPQTGRGGLR